MICYMHRWKTLGFNRFICPIMININENNWDDFWMHWKSEGSVDCLRLLRKSWVKTKQALFTVEVIDDDSLITVIGLSPLWCFHLIFLTFSGEVTNSFFMLRPWKLRRQVGKDGVPGMHHVSCSFSYLKTNMWKCFYVS